MVAFAECLVRDERNPHGHGFGEFPVLEFLLAFDFDLPHTSTNLI